MFFFFFFFFFFFLRRDVSVCWSSSSSLKTTGWNLNWVATSCCTSSWITMYKLFKNTNMEL